VVVVVAYGSGGRGEEGWQERGKSGMKGVRRRDKEGQQQQEEGRGGGWSDRQQG